MSVAVADQMNLFNFSQTPLLRPHHPLSHSRPVAVGNGEVVPTPNNLLYALGDALRSASRLHTTSTTRTTTTTLGMASIRQNALSGGGMARARPTRQKCLTPTARTADGGQRQRPHPDSNSNKSTMTMRSENLTFSARQTPPH